MEAKIKDVWQHIIFNFLNFAANKESYFTHISFIIMTIYFTTQTAVS